MSDETSSDHIQNALNDLMASFMDRYIPAATWHEADEHFTSSEIAEMFNSVYPIPLDRIFDTLTDNGFKCVPLSGRASFVWLLSLKRK